MRIPEVAVRRQRRPLAVRLPSHQVCRVRDGTQQAERVPLHGIERRRCELVRARRGAARAVGIEAIVARTLAAARVGIVIGGMCMS